MADAPFVLDQFQVDAIEHLDAGASVLVSAPTGTGKTVIADHVVARALEEGRMVVYTAPIKALSNQKFRDYCRLHGESNVGLMTGDLVIRREAPCLVMTTEILRNMLLTDDLPPRLRHVILDEIHFLDDRERGTTWEEVLIYLPPEVQVLGLSATLSNLEAFASWLSKVRGRETAVVREDVRAVPLQLHLVNRRDGLVDEAAYERSHKQWERWRAQLLRDQRQPRRGRRPQPRPQRHRPLEPVTRHVDVFNILGGEMRPYLYFVFSRRHTEQFAFQLAAVRPRLLDRREYREASDVMDRFEQEAGEGVLEHRLRRMYEEGVGFHHAGLHVQLKTLVEELYERKLIKVLYCTSTFALGINMPARAVVFDGLRKFDGREVVPLTVRQFLQKAGRAGRRGMDEVGHVVLRMDHDDWSDLKPWVDRYRTQAPEPVRSSFNLSFNSVANLLERHPLPRIRDLLARSFSAFQHAEQSEREEGEVRRLESSIRRMVPVELLPEEDAVPHPAELPPPARARARELHRLRRRLESREDKVWMDFMTRVHFLKEMGYLGSELEFNAGARVVAQVQISEIFVAELMLSGLLDDLDPVVLFGLFTGMVQTLGRAVALRDPPGREVLRLASKVNRIRFGRAVTGAERITRMDTTWSPELISFGVAWARGESMADLEERIDSPTDITGDLVGAFRRARDLLGQVIPLWTHDPERQDALRALLRSTGRDEVEVVG